MRTALEVRLPVDPPHCCVRWEDVPRMKDIPGFLVAVRGLGTRAMVRVRATLTGPEQWADKVTGTLYSLDGVCLSNPEYRFTPTRRMPR